MTQDFNKMRIYIKHNSEDYIHGGIKLWIYKLIFRSIKTRTLLSLLLLMIILIISFFSRSSAIAFIGLVFFVLIIDFAIYFIDLIKEKQRINKYNLESGDDVEILFDKYFAYRQDNRDFKISQWKDIHEIYRINSPVMISFKDRLTKDVIILYKSEIQEGFEVIESRILSKSTVDPVV